MEKQFEKYKGIHPGIVLDRELKKRSLKQRPFALSIAEHPQTFNAITKGRRNLNTALALKIEKELQLEEGTLVFLQAYYDIKEEKNKQENSAPDLSLLRQSLFWDTEINRIDWLRQYVAVIERVFERGNNKEKEEITNFYGVEKVQSVLMAKDKKLPLINLK
ncbi:transcriptional regulator [Dyadobacter subterraneus]|uniref:Plasmid maintenance system antidote protein n=1 Tax=Dyadobacter subterraneus TaxID=2773304 RepID=A0ABR9W841_9BACT|nr:plasmid maintenance system antidote protein [Dyadobacter subterraneus]MBE9461633.1 plasmid maintenance system antidote protein [Dyadobacter subterraneus]